MQIQMSKHFLDNASSSKFDTRITRGVNASLQIHTCIKIKPDSYPYNALTKLNLSSLVKMGITTVICWCNFLLMLTRVNNVKPKSLVVTQPLYYCWTVKLELVYKWLSGFFSTLCDRCWNSVSWWKISLTGKSFFRVGGVPRLWPYFLALSSVERDFCGRVRRRS